MQVIEPLVIGPAHWWGSVAAWACLGAVAYFRPQFLKLIWPIAFATIIGFFGYQYGYFEGSFDGYNYASGGELEGPWEDMDPVARRTFFGGPEYALPQFPMTWLTILWGLKWLADKRLRQGKPD